MAAKQFPEVAEMVFELNSNTRGSWDLQAVLCEIAAPTGPETLPQKYLEFVLAHPKIGVAAASQNIVPNISVDEDNQNLIAMFDSIMQRNALTPPMIRVAFNISPGRLLNQLYNPRRAVHVCRWIRQGDSFSLTGVIEPLSKFTPDTIRRIIDSNWLELREILYPDFRRNTFRRLDGGIGETEDPRENILQYLETAFNNQEPGYDWRFDVLVGQIYDAYEKVQSIKLSKVWKPLIEFLNQCAIVSVQQFPYSGVPTCRSTMIVRDIKPDILSRIYPEVVLTTLNQISSTTKQRFYWNKRSDSFIEYYTTVPIQVFETLECYSHSFNRLGLHLEDLAVRKATEKFMEMEKSLNRQVNLKGTNYAREAKWAEVLESEGKSMRHDRYRLTVTVTSPEVIENLYHIKASSQIHHLTEIAYISSGIETLWNCEQFFVYLAPFQKVNPIKEATFRNNVMKSGFQIEIIEIIEVMVKLADGITEVPRSFWMAIGIYNGYHYLPETNMIPDSFVDETPVIPLDKAYVKDLIQHLSTCAGDKKIGTSLKAYLNLLFMRGRTTRTDGKLPNDILKQLEELVRSVPGASLTQMKEFHSNAKLILPEYGVISD